MPEESSEHLYYHHSGAFSLGGVLFALMLGLLLGAPLAWLYARFIRWDSYLIFNLIACFIFGALVGWISEQLLISRKCRSAAVTVVVALLVGLGSYYVSWAVWLHAVINQVSAIGFIRPGNMLAGILAVNEHGVWNFSGDVVKGGVLWAVWAVEAGLMLGCAGYFATNDMLEATFCEGCETWAKEKTGACTVAAGNAPPIEELATLRGYRDYLKGLKQHASELKLRLESKDLAYLEQLGPVQPEALAWYRFDLHSCPSCNMTNTLRVTQLRRKIEGQKVRKQTEDEEVLRQLLLSSTEVEALRKLNPKPEAS